ncbi:MAG: hypothetical protein QXR44_05585 [Thermoproteota archaeon]
MSFLKKFFKSLSLSNQLLIFEDEQLLAGLYLHLILQSQKELMQILAEIFSAFQESLEYKILAALIKHGPISKSRLSEVLTGDHTKILRGPLHRSFERLIKIGMTVEVKRNKRGMLYDIAPRYKLIVKSLVQASSSIKIPQDKS